MKTNKDISDHYTWGQNCDGWHLLKSQNMSIIQERMPPGTQEALHFHSKARQFFFVLSGAASFEADGEIMELNAQEGLHVKPKQKHKIASNGTEDLVFLVVSQPESHGYRTNVET